MLFQNAEYAEKEHPEIRLVTDRKTAPAETEAGSPGVKSASMGNRVTRC
jgi:hypothetical protein